MFYYIEVYQDNSCQKLRIMPKILWPLFSGHGVYYQYYERRTQRHITLKDYVNIQEYVLWKLKWNAVSVPPLLQFARYCCRGHVTLAMFPIRIFFSGHVRTSLGACTPN